VRKKIKKTSVKFNGLHALATLEWATIKSQLSLHPELYALKAAQPCMALVIAAAGSL